MGIKVLPLTHKEMTRFFDESQRRNPFCSFFTYKHERWEILIPKLPSVRIVDIIKVLGCKPNEIGVRPGEKIFETLCPNETCADTIEFKNFFCIKPNLVFSSKAISLTIKTKKESLLIKTLVMIRIIIKILLMIPFKKFARVKKKEI